MCIRTACQHPIKVLTALENGGLSVFLYKETAENGIPLREMKKI